MADDPFRRALAFTLQWEGGYSNHPNDKGGATNKGITQRVYDHYRMEKGLLPKLVRLIKDEEVEDIYRVKYWNAAECFRYPDVIAIALFDFAVNSGVDRAVKYLKQSNGSIQEFLDSREQFFRTIGKGKQLVFLKGWINRLNALRGYLAKGAH